MLLYVPYIHTAYCSYNSKMLLLYSIEGAMVLVALCYAILIPRPMPYLYYTLQLQYGTGGIIGESKSGVATKWGLSYCIKY